MFASRSLVAALIAAGLFLRLAIAWAPFDPWQLQHGPLVDDSFYYFEIARNISLGLGPTHDGVVMTSGFQPLWAFALAPLWLLSEDPVFPIHLAMTICAVLGSFTGWGLWRLVRHLAGDVGALFALCLWTLSPYVLQHTMNGMETSLVTSLLVWSALFYTTRIRPGDAGTRDWVTLGILGGLCYLARADAAIFLVAVGLDGLFRFGLRATLRGGALAAGLALLIASPWIVWCSVLGSPLPESGPAIRQLSELYAPLGAYSSHAFGSFGFGFDNLVLLIGHLLVQPLVPLPSVPVGYALDQWLDQQVSTWFTIAIYVGLVGLVYFGPLRRILPRGRVPGFFWIWVALFLFAYAVFIPGQWFYDRYTFELTTFGVALAGLVFQGVYENLRPLAFAAYAVVSLLGIATVFAHQGVAVFGTTGDRNVVGYYGLARTLRESPQLPEPMAVIQSGVMGYFSERRFVALDGKVNGEAAAALRERKLFTYLESQGVRFVVDSYPWLVKLILHECSQDEPRPLLRRESLRFDGERVGLGVFIQR